MNTLIDALAFELSSLRTFSPVPMLAHRRREPGAFAGSQSPESQVSTNQFKSEMKLIEDSCVFDKKFYLERYPDIADAGMDPLEHYVVQGFREARAPNPIFDHTFYTREVQYEGTERNPLLHYIQEGERQGAAPCALFDPDWYRSAYVVAEDELALSHYLKNRLGPFSPVKEFDATFYLKTYPDIAAAGIDPFQHYVSYGFKEGRNPSPEFDTKYYVRRYLGGKDDECPLVHYRRNRHSVSITRPSDDDPTIPANVRRFTKAGPLFEEPRGIAESVPRKAKVLAYYLTQFHAFPENDKWWGKGFTEWTNVPRGLPRFHGHFQPRVPRDAGFYSLLDEDTLRKQTRAAKSGGIYGFVFYYYWFNTKRLMEKPLEAFLRNRDIDMPFCLMWANESWTRRWDGLEGEVLISQDYSEDDDEKLIADFARHFADHRYIRAQGRPLLMVYRPGLVPDSKRTFERWRALFRTNHGEDPIMIMSQSFDDNDPTVFGIDGAIEFPPHKITKVTPLVNETQRVLDEAFSGQVYAYEDVVRVSLEEQPPAFPLIKTAVPSWDNDARRQGNGLVIHGSTPRLYEDWLAKLVARAQQVPFFGEPFVCINAWNEWCEGAYLESDLHFGSAYLNATARAATGLTQVLDRPRIVLIGHDAFPSGAQMLLINIGRALRRAHGMEVEFILLGKGKLEADYAAVAPTSLCLDKASLKSKLQDLRERGFKSIVANTVASGTAVELASALEYRTVLLVHELPRIVKEKGLAPVARAGLRGASQVVFPGTGNRERMCAAMDLPVAEGFVVRPQGSYKDLRRDPAAADAVRRELGMKAGHALVIGVGYADMRKGFDLFLQMWRMLEAPEHAVHFCWIGNADPGMEDWLGDEIADAVKTGTFHMAGFQNEVAGFFSAADAYVLTSREDPFPTVALEAMSVGVPVLAFDRTGGIPDLLKEYDVGIVVPYGNVTAMATRLADLLNDGPDRAMLDRAEALVAERFGFPAYVRDLVRFALPHLADVSVVIPNYNYAHTLPPRMATVFTQTYPTAEVIVLDDASPDDSVAVIEATAAEHGRDITLVQNETNSGSVFRQWRKGAELARGDYLWIAEADDLSEPSFLGRLMAEMAMDPAIAIGFTDSKSIDMAGAPVYPSYKAYYATVEREGLTRDEVFEGEDFVRRFLSVKNLILNVSCVVWRRDALLRALDACEAELAQFKMAGDWRLYVEALMQPGARIAYVAEELNIHRRHASSVTHALDWDTHLSEVQQIHRLVHGSLGQPAIPQHTAYIAELRKQARL